MSHISENRTNIQTANEAILQETLELVKAANPGMTLETHYKNWGRQPVKCDVALHSAKIPRGLGINFKDHNKGLLFIGDFDSVSVEVKRIQDLILQTYYTVATRKALEIIGYETAVPQQEGETVVLEVVNA